jgi:uncharacterized delta-60 repeat protein
MKPISKLFILALILFTAYSLSAQTCPGCLDTTFGNGGVVVASVNGGTASGWANAIAIQPDGKIVVAVESSNAENTSAWDFYVLRFDSTGSLDSTFGTGGVVRFAFSAEADHEWPASIAIQGDGKILVAGRADANYNVGVARLNSDGSFDSAFGAAGKLTFTLVARQSAIPNSIIAQSDGRIAIGLNANNAAFGFVRLNTDGTFDTTFNGTGKLVPSGAKGNSSTVALIDMTIQPDGKYLASGMLPGSKGGGQFGLMRVNANGTLDTTFGSGGKVVTNLGGTWSAARNVGVLADGKIIASGDWLAGGTTGNQSYVFTRYLANGQLDTSFGTAGKALFASPDFRRMTGMTIQPDGKIVGSGWDRNPNTTNANVFILRINPNGGLDSGFGAGGMTFTDYNGLSDEGNSMAVQSDGKFVVAGVVNGFGPGTSIGLYRYLP